MKNKHLHHFLTPALCAGLALSLLFSMYRGWHISTGLGIVLFALQWLVLCMCAYTLVPALLSLFIKNEHQNKPDNFTLSQAQNHAFVLLIPAHNEAAVIAQTLESIRALDYPDTLFNTVLIADNCTDQTTQIAKNFTGVQVFERTTHLPSDKTQALHYAAQIFEKHGFGSSSFVVVLDADGSLEPDFLRQLSLKISSEPNIRVLQTNRRVLNLHDSDITLLDAASEALRQRVNSQLREAWGLENYLYGLGGVFEMHIFTRLTTMQQLVYADDKAWKAHLTTLQIPVHHATHALLNYCTNCKPAAFQRQRLRWISGHYDMIYTFFIPVLRKGIQTLNLSALDFAGSILTFPRSFLLLFLAIFTVVAYSNPDLSLVLWPFWLLIIAAFPVYAAYGLYLVKVRPMQYLLVIRGLSLIFGIIKSNLQRLLSGGEKSWDIQREPQTEQMEKKTVSS
jgi:cellulose synthase/poly-beta-1,6-N-acetylglucosamine synthase-like glycosyltransferase